MNRTITTIAAAALLLLTAGCASPSTGTASTAPAQDDQVQDEPTPTAASISKDDFQVKLKVTSQQCFGSAGCTVTVKPRLAYDHDTAPSEGAVDITYRILGDESGPITETLSLDLSTGRFYGSETLMSTTTAATPSVKIVDVELQS